VTAFYRAPQAIGIPFHYEATKGRSNTNRFVGMQSPSALDRLIPAHQNNNRGSSPMATDEMIVIAQPRGLTLRLIPYRPHWVQVDIVGGGMAASSRVRVDASELSDFFKSAANREQLMQGSLEYKGSLDENFVLRATSAGESDVLLHIDLLATAGDNADWQVNGTIILPFSTFRDIAVQVAQRFA
jgi:hypothetical protein